jgi:hypothetical protein
MMGHSKTLSSSQIPFITFFTTGARCASALDQPPQCRNPSFGLATKAKGLQGCGPKGSPGVTSGTPGSVGKCEGVNLHTPKATPALGDGVPVDSRNFRGRFEGSNLNGLWRSLYQWKDFEA